ncbi:MAG TPA: hypothetical protein VFX78_01005, partial [Candidatus Eisenbacteria bacterium]|nr:hypothetical protein [Candidatus Eisenbacteria bacterium]
VVDVFSKGWLPSDLRVGRFKKPGAYTAIVSYSTRQTNAQYWIGTTSYSEVSSEIVKRLRKIPLVDLVDSVSFEVHERTR